MVAKQHKPHNPCLPATATAYYTHTIIVQMVLCTVSREREREGGREGGREGVGQLII